MYASYNLSSAYRSQGRYSDAEGLGKQVLALSEKQFGAEHPETLHVVDGLGSIYYAQGRYSEAEMPPKYALVSYEKH